MVVNKVLLLKATCCQLQHHRLSSKAMAMSSSFCNGLFCGRRKPISSFPSKTRFFVSFKAFSAQPDGFSSKDDIPAQVGFLGLGIMGSPMAQNLLKAGCNVTVWNRTKSKCDPLISMGATYKESPKEVAAACDVTFAMLADPESAVDVACGEQGAARGLGPGKGYVDVSTVDGVTSKLISEKIRATGSKFLEAPVSGSKKPAEDGQLIFLTAANQLSESLVYMHTINFPKVDWQCLDVNVILYCVETGGRIVLKLNAYSPASGDKALYERASPFLDIMGKSRFFLGDVGNGAAMKLVVNMIMGSMMAAFSEGLLLSEKAGLDPSVLVEGAINAPMYSMKGPSMLQSRYPTAFPLKHQQKDLRLALALAESVSQSTPIAAATNELFKVAKSRGFSDEDFSAVIESLKVPCNK